MHLLKTQSISGRLIRTSTEFEFRYADQLKQLYDLYFENSIGERSDFAEMELEPSLQQFARGEAVMVQYFNWIHRKVMAKYDKNIVAEDDLMMIPIYFGTKDDARENICIGNMWQHVVNADLDDEHKKMGKDFIDWLMLSDTGVNYLKKMAFMPPYKNCKRENVGQDRIEQYTFDAMMDPDKEKLYLAYTDMPKGNFMEEFTKSIFEYSQGQKQWEKVVDDFKSSFIESKKMEKGRIHQMMHQS